MPLAYGSQSGFKNVHLSAIWAADMAQRRGAGGMLNGQRRALEPANAARCSGLLLRRPAAMPMERWQTTKGGLHRPIVLRESTAVTGRSTPARKMAWESRKDVQLDRWPRCIRDRTVSIDWIAKRTMRNSDSSVRNHETSVFCQPTRRWCTWAHAARIASHRSDHRTMEQRREPQSERSRVPSPLSDSISSRFKKSICSQT